MQETTCTACQSQVPLGNAYRVTERTFCAQCLESLLGSQESGDALADEVIQLVDPTVCVNCETDNGSTEWESLAGLPTCATCAAYFRNRPFPGWLKLAAATFFLVAVAAFAYNWRFFSAYVDMRRGVRQLEAGNVERATPLLDSAAKRVPEIPEMAVLPNFLIAQELLAEDREEEALALLAKSRPHLSDDWRENYRDIELQAQMGIAFDNGDYDAFLTGAQKIAEHYPDNPFAVGSVASAFACKYATTGDMAFHRQSLEHLERARDLPEGDSPDFHDYENRIQHRLSTREIIKREEFVKRFPEGWTAEEGE